MTEITPQELQGMTDDALGRLLRDVQDVLLTRGPAARPMLSKAAMCRFARERQLANYDGIREAYVRLWWAVRERWCALNPQGDFIQYEKDQGIWLVDQVLLADVSAPYVQAQIDRFPRGLQANRVLVKYLALHGIRVKMPKPLKPSRRKGRKAKARKR